MPNDDRPDLDGLILLRFTPPPDPDGHQPEEVAVVGRDRPIGDGMGDLLVYAKWRGRWHANAGERYAVRHLLADDGRLAAENAGLRAERDKAFAECRSVVTALGDWCVGHRPGMTVADAVGVLVRTVEEAMADRDSLAAGRDRRPAAGKTDDGVEVRAGDPVWRVPWRERQAPEPWYATSSGGAERVGGGSETLDGFASTAEAAAELYRVRWRERFGVEPPADETVNVAEELVPSDRAALAGCCGDVLPEPATAGS